MSAQAARRLTATAPQAVPRSRPAAGRGSTAGRPDPDRPDARRRDARRRLRLIRRRRLDLLQDAALGFLLGMFVLIDSAGLGVVAILCLLAGLGLLASVAGERWLRRRQ